MVGSKNYKYGTPVIAFRTGDKVSLDYLNSYVKPEFRVDITRQFQPTKMSLNQAKESYPEWYERKIIKKDRSARKRWEIEEKVHGKDPYALYHWWLSKADEIKGGHRYLYSNSIVIGIELPAPTVWPAAEVASLLASFGWTDPIPACDGGAGYQTTTYYGYPQVYVTFNSSAEASAAQSAYQAALLEAGFTDAGDYYGDPKYASPNGQFEISPWCSGSTLVIDIDTTL